MAKVGVGEDVALGQRDELQERDGDGSFRRREVEHARGNVVDVDGLEGKVVDRYSRCVFLQMTQSVGELCASLLSAHLSRS